MNFKRSKPRYAAYIVLFCFAVNFFISCKKDDPTRAVITVLDGSTNAPVEGATVTLWQDTAVNPVNGVKSSLRVSKICDASGTAQFEFELQAFLNIEVIHPPDTGRSFIRLKEHETVTSTVYL